jgi:hypothetical protein
MTQTTTTRPASSLDALAAAEAALAAQIGEAAARIDQVATTAIDDALARLEASASAARARLEEARQRFAGIVGEVTTGVLAFTAQVAADLASQPAPAGSVVAAGKTAPSAPAVEPVPAGVEMVREFLRDGIAGFSETTETLTAGEAVRRGVLTQEEADGIARQAPRFAQVSANAPQDNATDQQPVAVSQTHTTAPGEGEATQSPSPEPKRRSNPNSKRKRSGRN